MPARRIPLEKPIDFGDQGSKFWDHIIKAMGRKLRQTDQAALVMACRWIDRFDVGRKDASKAADIQLGIATDKFLLLSTKFGFTPEDRKKIGDDGIKKPKAATKTTALDELGAKALGAKSASNKD